MTDHGTRPWHQQATPFTCHHCCYCLRIAVEIQNSLSASAMQDLERALGQFTLYQDLLEEQEPARILFVAVPDRVQEVFDEPIGQLLLRKQRLRVLVCNPQNEVLPR